MRIATGNWAAGKLLSMEVTSTALAANRLGDPATRRIDIYIPAEESGKGLPLLVSLASFLSSGINQTGWRNFGENLPERLDRLIGTGKMPPVAVAFPDCFTRLGGNQYIDNMVMGNWERFLVDDLVPAVESAFSCGSHGRRGLFGKSSGGYGALMNALRHPDFWAAAACHSGDMGFEHCYLPEMPVVLRALANAGGSLQSLIEAIETATYSTHSNAGAMTHVLMILAMAVSYDPDPNPVTFLGLRLPIDHHTCCLIPERWQAWTAHDPAAMTSIDITALAKLKMLYFDCGNNDQYNLLYGARRFSQTLTSSGISHHYEEFPGNHSATAHRLDVSLPLLVKALSS